MPVPRGERLGPLQGIQTPPSPSRRFFFDPESLPQLADDAGRDLRSLTNAGLTLFSIGFDTPGGKFSVDRGALVAEFAESAQRASAEQEDEIIGEQPVVAKISADRYLVVLKNTRPNLFGPATIAKLVGATDPVRAEDQISALQVADVTKVRRGDEDLYEYRIGGVDSDAGETTSGTTRDAGRALDMTLKIMFDAGEQSAD
jgi:hypothetical protein